MANVPILNRFSCLRFNLVADAQLESETSTPFSMVDDDRFNCHIKFSWVEYFLIVLLFFCLFVRLFNGTLNITALYIYHDDLLN